MSFTLDREKELPAIPVDADASGIAEEDSGWAIPSSKNATFPDATKSLPSIKVEDTLEEDEVARLHELWNGAGLSARAHRRRRRERSPAKRRIPAPISIPDLPPTSVVPSANPSTASTTTTTAITTTGTRRRWGFRSARPFSETQGAEKKASRTLEKLRAIAQGRLKRKLRYAKSAPNLGDQAAVLCLDVTSRPAMPMSAWAASGDGGSSNGCDSPLPDDLAAPEAVPQQEDADKNAIYFTIDPNWRSSQGSVQFESITPVPDSLALLGRPDSPLLHRYHSLDQLSFAAMQATTSSTVMEALEVYREDQGLHPIDELHAYVEH